jgi:hypothetical protein
MVDVIMTTLGKLIRIDEGGRGSVEGTIKALEVGKKLEAVNLAAARLRHMAGTKWARKRYLDIKPLGEPEEKIA